MPIDEIGSVYNIVDNAVIVIAKVSGEYRVLDSGVFLCLRIDKCWVR